jgi:predicted phosphodiesterase
LHKSLRNKALALATALALVALAGCSTDVKPVPKRPDYSQVPQTIAVIGDYGVGDKHEAAVAKMVERFAPTLTLSVGDNRYKKAGYQRLVGRYYKQDIVAATGNHDYLMGIGAFDDFFGQTPTTRTFTYEAESAVDFFILDSEAGMRSRAVREGQKAWLIRALANSNRAFKVVILHHPPYSSGKHSSTKRYQWDFADMGADLVISGHDHTYERIVRHSATYIVDWTGRAKLYKCKRNPVYGSKICLDNYFGALFLYVNDSQLRGVFRTSAGAVLDTFTFSK